MEAAMPPEKSRSLHNFTLPPLLSWGSQRFLRCSKADSAAEKTSTAIDGDIHYTRRPRRRDPDEPDCKRKSISGEGDRIEVMREKIMIDLQSEVDKIKTAILVEGGDADHSAVATEDPKPWNLRTRRAACHELIDNCCGDEEKPRRKRFSITLSRQEVEEDFWELNRRRPARKPKKRPKYLQKELDMLSPGYRLSEITADMYKVDETLEGQ